MSCLMYYLFLFAFNIFVFNVTSADMFEPEKWDLPTKKELYNYLGVVESIVDYSISNKKGTNIALAFGLFLANVNLDHALREKGRLISRNLKKKIKNIIEKNNRLLIVLNIFAKNNKKYLKKRYKLSDLLSLFNNSSYWVENMQKFKYTEEMQYTSNELRKVYSYNFGLYLSKVDNYGNWVPSPKSSDDCLASLSKNPINKGPYPLKCAITNICYNIVRGGTNFGYSLTHRIMLLLMARFGRKCIIFSHNEDRALVKQLCSMAHAEASYIAENNFGFVDLFLEIIGLCSIDGHAQFLQRPWLNNMLNFQTPEGCYGAVPVEGFKDMQKSIFTTNVGKFNNIFKKGCHAHTTAVAVVTFAGAVRFIIEEYYY